VPSHSNRDVPNSQPVVAPHPDAGLGSTPLLAPATRYASATSDQWDRGHRRRTNAGAAACSASCTNSGSPLEYQRSKGCPLAPLVTSSMCAAQRKPTRTAGLCTRRLHRSLGVRFAFVGSQEHAGRIACRRRVYRVQRSARPIGNSSQDAILLLLRAALTSAPTSGIPCRASRGTTPLGRRLAKPRGGRDDLVT